MLLPKTILVLAPHTDDAELGAGGSIAKWIEAGVEVHVAVFSTAEESLPEGSAPTRLADECHESLDVLGVPRGNRTILSYPVRKLSYHRQEVLEHLVQLGRDIDPDWVLAPSGADLHQDHATIHDEALRAFKHKTLLGYELPWNHITFSASAFVTLERRHLDTKWAALTKYESQLEMGRTYFTPEFHDSLARVRGLQVKHEWAEAFELIRIVL
ncbi:PIG-L deacetylase family protein [Tessaracoccus sp. OH4464_COT-324]|uniref:PIG-L deacetylase family protein n=1 Tax=Tessaracoccus sp. OH4464_COT-324 TaxID=2491059 RepID=UPI000F6303FC|nr:PIG-L deacetylase family protein [Tessaracoccus sp. OH4464_COT-324]RRD46156.1 PIG-L family deacetylase [Tessaracoccus sp. OH4464_COT-324]